MIRAILQCLCAGGAKPAYVRIKIGGTRVAETRHARDRVWNQTFRILCSHPADTIIAFSLMTMFSTLGEAKIAASSLIEKGDQTLSPLLLTNNGSSKTKLRLLFRLTFRHAESEPDWGQGLRRGGFAGIRHGVTFPQRSNCGVILYQDAHHGSNFRPGQLYRPRRLWEDVCKAINGSKSFIYIAGWSLNPRMILVSSSIWLSMIIMLAFMSYTWTACYDRFVIL